MFDVILPARNARRRPRSPPLGRPGLGGWAERRDRGAPRFHGPGGAAPRTRTTGTGWSSRVGPHAPDGSYARVEFDLGAEPSPEFEPVGEHDGAGVVAPGGRGGDARATVKAPGRLEVIGDGPWGWEGAVGGRGSGAGRVGTVGRAARQQAGRRGWAGPWPRAGRGRRLARPAEKRGNRRRVLGGDSVAASAGRGPGRDHEEPRHRGGGNRSRGHGSRVGWGRPGWGGPHVSSPRRTAGSTGQGPTATAGVPARRVPTRISSRASATI